MSLSSACVWEVRATGSDLNGGGFVAGASGTDYSQSDTPIATGTVTSSTTTVTATTGIFTSAMVGNLITDGTAWKQITGFTSSTVVTVDSAPSWTAATIKVGGALATFNKLATVFVNSNTAWIKAGTGYTSTSTLTFSASLSPGAGAPPNRLIGYTTTRGDNGRATLTLATNTGLTGINCTGQGWSVRNLVVDCAGLGTSKGIVLGNYSDATNCVIKNFTTTGIQVPSQSIAQDCEITGGTAGTAVNLASTPGGAHRLYIHDNAAPGVTMAVGTVVTDCLIINNTGASTDGILSNYCTTILHNTIYGSGRHGIKDQDNYGIPGQWRGNLLAGNGGFGIVGAASAGNPAASWWDGNAYWNNTSGARSNMDDTTVNVINSVTPYVNTLDVILTADPFVAKASGDFRLNTTAGGGAACRGHGTPVSWVGNSLTTAAPDIGAAQHADAGGAVLQGAIIGGS